MISLLFPDIYSEHTRKANDGGYLCNICDKKARDSYAMKKHLEGKHDITPGYNCHVCNLFCRTSSILENHRRNFHYQGGESDHNQTVGVEPIITEIETTYKVNEEQILPESIADSVEELSDTYDYSDVTLVKTEEIIPVLNTNLELDIQIEESIEKIEGLWTCKVCGKTAKRKKDLKSHAERHIEGVSYPCHLCNSTLSTRKSLQQHITNIHSDLSFTCHICDKTGMNKATLRMHIVRNHKTTLVNS